MYLIVVGSTKTYGILFTELDEHYNMGSGPVAIIGSLMFLLMFSSGKITLVTRKPVLNVSVEVKLILRTATREASTSFEMSRIMRIPTFCICENKDADQLRGNREADLRLCFRYTGSTTTQLPKSEISSL